MLVRNVLLTCMCVFCWTGRLAAASADGVLTVNVVEEGSGQPLPVRMELRKSGRPVRIRPEGAIALDGYLVFEGSVRLELKKGNYEFFIEAGPEYQTREGHFSIERHAEDASDVTITRRANMQSEGWWAGDLDAAQNFDDMPLLMRAAGIDFVPMAVAKNGKAASQPLLIGFDKTTSTHIRVAPTPFAWHLPVWIASGQLDAIQILHRYAHLDKVATKVEEGYPRDRKIYPGAIGNGRWSEAIYHHLLNCGLRIPPAAGSGSGTNGNPVGTNRVYTLCGEQCNRDNWIAALKAGKVVVTNGPLLRTKVEGHPPGHVFPLAAGEEREFQIALSLTFYEKAAVEYLEILKNGHVVHQIRLRDLAERQGRLPPLRFDESGWFAVRAMASNTTHYQYATTGPYYVELDGRPRISRRSVQFFLDWLQAAEIKFNDDKTILNEIKMAKPFWNGLLAAGTAE